MEPLLPFFLEGFRNTPAQIRRLRQVEHRGAIGVQTGLNGSPGGVRYRAPYGANNNGIRDACSTADIIDCHRLSQTATDRPKCSKTISGTRMGWDGIGWTSEHSSAKSTAPIWV